LVVTRNRKESCFCDAGSWAVREVAREGASLASLMRAFASPFWPLILFLKTSVGVQDACGLRRMESWRFRHVARSFGGDNVCV
jgi:hypothetical protein